jgi:hypothetical protein
MAGFGNTFSTGLGHDKSRGFLDNGKIAHFNK